MVKNSLVLILAQKKNMSLFKMKIIKDTDDYLIACEIKRKLENNSINVLLKELENRNIEEEKMVLNRVRLVLAVVSDNRYLSAVQKIVGQYEQLETFNKKIIYVCPESYGDLRVGDIALDSVFPNCMKEDFSLSDETSLDKLVNIATTYIRNSPDYDDNYLFVDKVLKSYRSDQDIVNNAIERDWLKDKICSYIFTLKKKKRIIWLCGEHGSGKSYFVGDFYAHLHNVCGKGIYYCKCTSRDTQNTQRIIKAISYSLNYNNAIPGYADAIYPVVSRIDFESMSAEELFSELLVNPFIDNPEIIPVKGKFVFIIDGIDELHINQNDTLKSFLEVFRNYSANLPSFLYIIITSPMIKLIEDTINQLSKAYILNLDSENYISHKKIDADRFLRRELNDLGIKFREDEINVILEKADWNFDYLHYFIDQCDELDGKIPDLSNLPKGLESMFSEDFKNRFSPEYYRNSVKPVLQVITTAYEPIFSYDLAEILQWTSYHVQTVIKGQLRQFLKFDNEASQNETVSLYNRSLQLWLTKLHEHSIDEAEGNEAFVKWIVSKHGHFKGSSYLQKYALTHLLENKKYCEIKDIIVESSTDDFESLKEELADIVLQDYSYKVDLKTRLLSIYRQYYLETIRIRDILVYSYRYVFKRKGNNVSVLKEICNLLIANDEDVRAHLLAGESIADYSKAKKHFENSILLATERVSSTKGNKWWNERMLGVAYNRLANLENKNGNIDDAERLYLKGKNCFGRAEDAYKGEKSVLSQPFKNDYKIILRDLAIINERLGDIFFQKKGFSEAERYYGDYYNACQTAFREESTLYSKWDVSISLLRVGDAKRYLGKLHDAKKYYKLAFEYRRDILQYLRNDCMDLILCGNTSLFKDFYCPDTWNNTNDVDDVPRESRDIEPIRDLAMCYVRLGDLAYLIRNIDVARYYYDYFNKLCNKNRLEIENMETEKDMRICQERMSRVSNQ